MNERSGRADDLSAPPGAGLPPAPKRRGWLIAGVVLSVLALLLVGGYAALRHAYPPARIAAALAAQVTAATGRKFSIGGDLSIRIFPTIGVEVNDIALANADWGSRPDMVRIRQAAFEVSLRDLLDGRVRVLGVELQGADVLLESDGEGRFNWQFGTRQPSGSEGKRAPSIELDRLVASDARITYDSGKGAPPRVIDIQTLDLDKRDNGRHLAAGFEAFGRHWKLDGDTGPVNMILAGLVDWPFDLRFTTDGARISTQGTLGTGPRARTFEAKVTARIEKADVLKPLGAVAAVIPMPVDWSGTVRRTPDEWRADPMQATAAGQAMSGSVSYRTGKGPPSVDVALTAASIDLGAWGMARKTGATAPGAQKQLFGDNALPFDALPRFPLRVALKVERLNAPGAATFSGVDLLFDSQSDRLLVEPLSFGFAGGQVRGRMKVGFRKDAAPRSEISLEAKSLSVDVLDAMHSSTRHFNGGRANVSLSLSMSGRTPRALAASSTGNVLFSVRDVPLVGRAAALDRDIVMRLLDALLPKQASRADLVVQCVVVRLPLRNGVAAIDRSIAMETSQIAVSASGEVNLAKQTIALAFRPQVKKGLDLNAGNLVQLLLLKGPLEQPEVSIDPKGIVREAATLGVASATGGLSLLVPSLRSGAEGSECERAARGSGATTAKGQTGPSDTGRNPFWKRPFASGKK